MTTVLIIEDDVTFSQLLEGFLEKNGFATTVAENVKSGKAFLQNNSYDLVLLDYRLPDGLGTDILTFLRDEQLQVPAIIMTSFHDIRTAVKTIRLGARDYVTKPVNPDELLLAMRDVLNRKNIKPEDVPKPKPQFIEGVSSVARQLHEYIQLVAPTDFSVIIEGESGTGKELAARNIHELSKRKDAPFVAIDCGALSSDLAGSVLFGHIKGAFTGAMQNKSGLFEEANGGTLFLDEVGNLSYEIQVKLLRALQERIIQPVGSNQQVSVDVRIISATNDNLLNAVKSGKFREDLYHRLNEFNIRMPSLGERKEDIPLFINFFIEQTNNELGKNVKGVSDDVSRLFLNYDWPGNLRELRNIIKRAVLLTNTDEISAKSLPEEMLLSAERNVPVNSRDLKAIQEMSEREQILKALIQTKYNKSKAAKLLNIDRTTLYYKLSKYGID